MNLTLAFLTPQRKNVKNGVDNNTNFVVSVTFYTEGQLIVSVFTDSLRSADIGVHVNKN
jgi:hypothetical protein